LRLSSEITICDPSDLVPSRAGNRQVQHNCLIVKVISDKNRFSRIAPHLFAQKIKCFRPALKIVRRWPNSREGTGISKEQLVDQDKIEIVPKAIEIVLNELVNPDGDDCNYQPFAVQFVQGLKTISCKASGLPTIFDPATCQSATLEMIASLLTPFLVRSDSGRSKTIGKGCELLGQMVQIERHTLCLRSGSRVRAIACGDSSGSWYAFSVFGGEQRKHAEGSSLWGSELQPHPSPSSNQVPVAAKKTQE